MRTPEFNAEELLSSLCDLHVRDQISVLEEVVSEHAIADVADVVALCMMTVLLGIDDSCPPDLRRRLDALAEKVRRFNADRFGTELPTDAGR
ncbi:hypothetical protein [Burkholderia gladioli]|uniref:hypothetical protein n=1 Tax=Burkholderia gladioli TaxID=28095 RepID=UPI00163FE80E|nr:hypothetical protein [Burkholderia gladioli]